MPTTKTPIRTGTLVEQAHCLRVRKQDGPHLDGHAVELKRSGVTAPGFTQQVPGEGMPTGKK